MDKTKISVVTIGHIPPNFQKNKVENWPSSVFEISGEIESYALSNDSDGDDWEFTDSNLETILPNHFEGDFLVGIVNVPLELNWYTRRLHGDRLVFTFHEIKDFLAESNIPLENVVYRLLYAYTLLYKRSGNRIPMTSEHTNFAHDETRGCLFDMNGIKSDIVYSLNGPIICQSCVEKLRQETVSNELISKIQKEIRRIKKPLFYRIANFVKLHPIFSLLISAISAIVLGAIGSLIASVIYESIKHKV